MGDCPAVVNRALPSGVFVRSIREGSQANRTAFQEVRVGNKIYRVEGQVLPDVQLTPTRWHHIFVQAPVSAINGQRVESLEERTVVEVSRGRGLFQRCGDCGKRESSGWVKLAVGLMKLLVGGVVGFVAAVVVQNSPPPAHKGSGGARPAGAGGFFRALASLVSR